MSQPNDAPPVDPRGVCGACQFFIDDTTELNAELAYQARGGAVLNTVERETNERGRQVGAGLKRVALSYESLVRALYDRTGLPPDRVGLCEKGVANFVDRCAGAAVDKTTGVRLDQCPKWQEKSTLYVRRPDWRTMRDLTAERAKGMAAPSRKIGRNEPCTCGSGKKYKHCHGGWLAGGN